MCGITGFWSRSGGALPADDLQAIAVRMATALTHRGPDHQGSWTSPGHGLALAHRRLSILDLSPDGHQPMFSASQRFVIVFNGEIYNFPALRATLEGLGKSFRSRSDTEVVSTAFETWGIEASLQKLVGMFALAAWDQKTATLTLARDRIGEKPLYYGLCGDTFLFGSELKPLRQHPRWQGRIDRGALSLFLQYNYVPTPHTIYEGIAKLPPGCFLTIPGNDSGLPQPVPYWSAGTMAANGLANLFTGSDDEAVNALEALLKDAVKGQMLSDVPLGAFLSGGIDSSTIVALMQAQSTNPVKTFTIGFNEPGFNEAEHARAVASHLRTDHTELYVTSEEARQVIPRLPAMYDEPFADSSQIPTFLVARLARSRVTVSLSGDAGDELFGGYTRYFVGQQLWNHLSRFPGGLRSFCARALAGTISVKTLDRFYHLIEPVLPARFRQRLPGDKFTKLLDILDTPSFEDMYRRLVSFWKQPERLVVAGHLLPTLLTNPANGPPGGADDIARMMFFDLLTYLPDDILVKVDRACMAVSLESRVPLLDHRVVEFAWRLPLRLKIREGQGKWILRQILYRHVPRELIERPKMGFGVPIDSWLRGPLRDWAETLLGESRLKNEGFLDPQPIREKWQEHLAGRRNWQYHLWGILMFQAWLEQQSL